jgi:hypothetical protein
MVEFEVYLCISDNRKRMIEPNQPFSRLFRKWHTHAFFPNSSSWGQATSSSKSSYFDLLRSNTYSLLCFQGRETKFCEAFSDPIQFVNEFMTRFFFNRKLNNFVILELSVKSPCLWPCSTFNAQGSRIIIMVVYR